MIECFFKRSFYQKGEVYTQLNFINFSIVNHIQLVIIVPIKKSFFWESNYSPGEGHQLRARGSSEGPREVGLWVRQPKIGEDGPF